MPSTQAAVDAADAEFLRTASRPLGVAAWHGALVPESLDALAADAVQLLSLAGDETFWVSADESAGAARCTLERLAMDVLHFHAARGSPRPITGCEWWVQVRRSDGPVPGIALHWDSDEAHAAGSGEHVPPWLATVSYVGGAGAPTVVLPVAANRHGRGLSAGDGDGAEGVEDVGVVCGGSTHGGGAALPPGIGAGVFVSHPVPGKHLAFDGRLLHGALHELAAEGGGGGGEAVAAAEPTTRVTLLVNLWAGRTPAQLSRLPERVAACLSNLEATRLRGTRLDGDSAAEADAAAAEGVVAAPLTVATRRYNRRVADGEWRELRARVVSGGRQRAYLSLQVRGVLPSLLPSLLPCT